MPTNDEIVAALKNLSWGVPEKSPFLEDLRDQSISASRFNGYKGDAAGVIKPSFPPGGTVNPRSLPEYIGRKMAVSGQGVGDYAEPLPEGFIKPKPVPPPKRYDPYNP